VLPTLGLIALVIARSARMGVSAGPTGLVVRNFGRDYQVPWDDVAGIDAGPSDNVTGVVTTIVIRRTDGTKLVGRGTSSYSRRAVERWRDELDAVHPARRLSAASCPVAAISTLLVVCHDRPVGRDGLNAAVQAVRSAVGECPGRGVELTMVARHDAREPGPPWPFELHVATGPGVVRHSGDAVERR
jgi:hypothetical protein